MDVDDIVTARDNARETLMSQLVDRPVVTYIDDELVAGDGLCVASVVDGSVWLEPLDDYAIEEDLGDRLYVRSYRRSELFMVSLPAPCLGQDAGALRLWVCDGDRVAWQDSEGGWLHGTVATADFTRAGWGRGTRVVLDDGGEVLVYPGRIREVSGLGWVRHLGGMS